jgi:hypothetical protein
VDKDPTAAQESQQLTQTNVKNLDGVTADITAGKYATAQQAMAAVNAAIP